MFCFNLPFRQELRGYPSLKQQPLFGHLDQDESNQLTHVHSTGHLFEPEQRDTAASSDGMSWIHFGLIIPSSLLQILHNRIETLLTGGIDFWKQTSFFISFEFYSGTKHSELAPDEANYDQNNKGLDPQKIKHTAVL